MVKSQSSEACQISVTTVIRNEYLKIIFYQILNSGILDMTFGVIKIHIFCFTYIVFNSFHIYFSTSKNIYRPNFQRHRPTGRAPRWCCPPMWSWPTPSCPCCAAAGSWRNPWWCTSRRTARKLAKLVRLQRISILVYDTLNLRDIKKNHNVKSRHFGWVWWMGHGCDLFVFCS